MSERSARDVFTKGMKVELTLHGGSQLRGMKIVHHPYGVVVGFGHMPYLVRVLQDPKWHRSSKAPRTYHMDFWKERREPMETGNVRWARIEGAVYGQTDEQGRPMTYWGGLAPSAPEQAVPHTDHPLRHWDRTCPGCIAEGTAPEREVSVPRQTAISPVAWAVTVNGEFTENVFISENAAKVTMENLNRSHPSDKREIVTLYPCPNDVCPDCGRHKCAPACPSRVS